MFFKPSLIFIMVWLPPLLIMYYFPGGLIGSLDFGFIFFLAFVSIFFVFIDIVFGLMFPRKIYSKTSFSFSVRKVDKFLTKLIAVWLFIYFLNILGSGGIPILWVLSGIDKTYADFGLPTLGGLANLLRAFAFTIFVYLYLIGYRKSRSKLWILILLISAFIVETGRGNGLVLALHGFGVWAMLRPVRFRYLPLLLILMLGLFLFLGGIQVLRYPEGLAFLYSHLESQGIDVNGNFIFALLAPTFLYWVGPVLNTQLNFQIADSFTFSPYYSVQGLFPTVIRDLLFESKDYGLLINEANNTTSFLTPLLRDFGVYGTAIAVVVIFMITSWVYHRARAGYFSSFLFWPPIFMSLVLTNFSLFYTSLVVVLFPVMIFIFKRYTRFKYV